MDNKLINWSKIFQIGILMISGFGYFYFETSSILRFLVVVFGGLIALWSFFSKQEKPFLNSRREILSLLILYLGLFTFYNLLYGVGIPLYLIMVMTWILVCATLYSSLILDRINTIFDSSLLWVYISLIGLVVLETFLSLSFWPIDPQFKCLIIIVFYYLASNLIYLRAANMLRLKRIVGFILAGLIILGLLILNIWQGLRGG